MSVYLDLLLKNVFKFLVQTGILQAFQKQYANRESTRKKYLKYTSSVYVDIGSYSSSTDCSFPHFSERLEVILLPLFPNSDGEAGSSVS